MSKCSDELDPIFDEIGTHALIIKGLKEGSPEWEKEDAYLEDAYKQALKIFKWYNPGFRSKSNPDEIVYMQAKSSRKKGVK